MNLMHLYMAVEEQSWRTTMQVGHQVIVPSSWPTMTTWNRIALAQFVLLHSARCQKPEIHPIAATRSHLPACSRLRRLAYPQHLWTLIRCAIQQAKAFLLRLDEIVFGATKRAIVAITATTCSSRVVDEVGGSLCG